MRPLPKPAERTAASASAAAAEEGERILVAACVGFDPRLAELIIACKAVDVGDRDGVLRPSPFRFHISDNVRLDAYDGGARKVDDRDILVDPALFIGLAIPKQADTGEAIPKRRPFDDFGRSIAPRFEKNRHSGVTFVDRRKLTRAGVENLPAVHRGS